MFLSECLYIVTFIAKRRKQLNIKLMQKEEGGGGGVGGGGGEEEEVNED